MVPYYSLFYIISGVTVPHKVSHFVEQKNKEYTHFAFHFYKQNPETNIGGHLYLQLQAFNYVSASFVRLKTVVAYLSLQNGSNSARVDREHL